MKTFTLLRPLQMGVFCACLVAVMMLFSGSAEAATLKFSPSSASVSVGNTVDVKIDIDATGKEVTGTDALINFDKDKLEVVSITNGTFLEVAEKEFSDDGKIYVAGVLENAGVSVTGAGTLATITLRGKSNGIASLKFECVDGETNESNIPEFSADAVDLIECSANGSATVTVGGSTSDPAPGSARTPSSLPRTGVVENMIFAAIAGGVLLLFGFGLRKML